MNLCGNPWSSIIYFSICLEFVAAWVVLVLWRDVLYIVTCFPLSTPAPSHFKVGGNLGWNGTEKFTASRFSWLKSCCNLPLWLYYVLGFACILKTYIENLKHCIASKPFWLVWGVIWSGEIWVHLILDVLPPFGWVGINEYVPEHKIHVLVFRCILQAQHMLTMQVLAETSKNIIAVGFFTHLIHGLKDIACVCILQTQVLKCSEYSVLKNILCSFQVLECTSLYFCTWHAFSGVSPLGLVFV